MRIADSFEEKQKGLNRPLGEKVANIEAGVIALAARTVTASLSVIIVVIVVVASF